MSSLFKVKLPAAAAILGLAAYVVFLEVEANQESDERIGSSAVWNASDHDLEQIRESCKRSNAEDYSQCFIDHMADAGAPPEAIDFTQEYAQDHDGAIAILRSFHPKDAVDVGYAYFPYAKGPRQSAVLLNGSPEILDLSDIKLLPDEQIARDAQYLALQHAHPQIGVFPDEALTQGALPPMQKLSSGGQRFAIDYSLRDGCGSCAVLGQARFNFDFDPTGQFQGARLAKVEAGK